METATITNSFQHQNELVSFSNFPTNENVLVSSVCVYMCALWLFFWEREARKTRVDGRARGNAFMTRQACCYQC